MRQRRRLSRQLGIDLPEWEDDGAAPPVDEGVIREMLEGRANHEERRRAWMLILRFRSWAEAYCRLGIGQRDDG